MPRTDRKDAGEWLAFQLALSGMDEKEILDFTRYFDDSPNISALEISTVGDLVRRVISLVEGRATDREGCTAERTRREATNAIILEMIDLLEMADRFAGDIRSFMAKHYIKSPPQAAATETSQSAITATTSNA